MEENVFTSDSKHLIIFQSEIHLIHLKYLDILHVGQSNISQLDIVEKMYYSSIKYSNINTIIQAHWEYGSIGDSKIKHIHNITAESFTCSGSEIMKVILLIGYSCIYIFPFRR